MQICLNTRCKTLVHSLNYNINQPMPFSIQKGREPTWRSYSVSFMTNNTEMVGEIKLVTNGQVMGMDKILSKKEVHHRLH